MKPTIPPLVIKRVKTGKFHQQKMTVDGGQSSPPKAALDSSSWADPDHCHRLNDWCNTGFDQHQQHQVHQFPSELVGGIVHPGGEKAMSPENTNETGFPTSSAPRKSTKEIVWPTVVPSTSSSAMSTTENSFLTRLKPSSVKTPPKTVKPAASRSRKRRRFGNRKRRRVGRHHVTANHLVKVNYAESDWIPQDHGHPVMKWVYQSNDHFPVKRICYESIRHRRVTGIELRERDCVEVYSEDEQLTYIGKIARLYHDPMTGELTASLVWYYRPEQVDLERMDENQVKTVPTEVGNKELFTSRHLDTISVDSIQRTCFVLTFNEYIRNAKENLEDSMAATTGHLKRQDELISYGDAVYPRRSRQPNDETPDEVVYFARHLYDFAGKRFTANPTQYKSHGS